MDRLLKKDLNFELTKLVNYFLAEKMLQEKIRL
jgi:hypothetical protein